VVPDVHSTDLADAQIPIVYVPYWRPGAPLSTVVVRTAVEPSAVVGTLRRVVSAMDPELPLASVQTMQDVTRSSVAARRFQLLGVGGFAAITLLIAVTGIYSVLAYRVRGRTREIAVRMALGARQGTVVRMVVGQGIVPVLVGVAIGVGAALAFGRLLAALLFSVTPTHVPTLAGVAAVTLLTALPACLLPARRAARTAPLDALHRD
jgi:putative ABC transport system permease protein